MENGMNAGPHPTRLKHTQETFSVCLPRVRLETMCVFHIDVRSSKFDYRALRELLTGNVGGYIFSRAKIASIIGSGSEHFIDLKSRAGISQEC